MVEGQEGLSLGKSSKAWVAYVDEKKHGIGLLLRAPLSLHATAPWAMERQAQMALHVLMWHQSAICAQKGMTLKYRIYLTTGSLQEIQSRFAKIETVD